MDVLTEAFNEVSPHWTRPEVFSKEEVVQASQALWNCRHNPGRYTLDDIRSAEGRYAHVAGHYQYHNPNITGLGVAATNITDALRIQVRHNGRIIDQCFGMLREGEYSDRYADDTVRRAVALAIAKSSLRLRD